jgi:hypothetical protein
MFELRKKKDNKKGYITLITILIIASIGLSVSISLLLFGLNSSRSSFANEQSGQAKYLADACIEQALQEIRKNHLFSGNNFLSLKQGTCYYDVIILTGEKREIHSFGVVDDIVRKVKVVVNDIEPRINVFSWQEVSDL